MHFVPFKTIVINVLTHGNNIDVEVEKYSFLNLKMNLKHCPILLFYECISISDQTRQRQYCIIFLKFVLQ